ncbi:acyl-CoA thioesterase/bile acid-CoA:amino acid N-acyltransferase family protein [Anaerocolumna sp. MB42-C2]|uniref:acyl-CoA thioesterase/bile acid-CoA:amino acid N-acyltransferase family protein n=1 Tax=Anaerocolumna sp. MB42-C2 TaxID=3070997 RepID=UPI0027E0D623|nr:acyl-CoA thioesterase/bile acid-CoA:amino acid N-acyltransferase family protein [Anaerocolumna sp. MB42-C2]WMJ89171.1 acyl-CoA thioesterase/bile acid-CoA:amino acid N-acyltransferase family protein [Anaerocolumna sp. MB42-C2]
MQINVNEITSMVDDQIHIVISGLSSGSILKIKLNTALPWCPSLEFSSYANYIANSTGIVDLDTAVPIEGTYRHAHPMGLVYSLQATAPLTQDISANINVDHPMFFHFTFETDMQTESLQITRLFKTDDIHITPIHDSFNGQLFHNGDKARKMILMLGGSDGQMEALSLLAAPLASRGFNVLVIPYFGAEDLPEKLEMVPLEYFEKIFHWIETNTLTQMSDIYLHGTSKGSELALLLASRYPQIKKVAAVEAHTYCFQALDGLMSGNLVSSWSYKGTSIPFIPVDNNIFFEELKKDVKNNVPFGFASTYKHSIENATNREEARIKIENASADILLICGKSDNIWNSYDGCQEILNAAKTHTYKQDIKLLAYEDMGHPLPIPYVLPIALTLKMPMNGGIFTSGGTIEGNSDAQYDSWKKTIAFFLAS